MNPTTAPPLAGPDDVAALCWAELVRRRADCSHEGLFRVEPAQAELDGVERQLDGGADGATTLRGASNDCLAALFKRRCVPESARPLAAAIRGAVLRN